MIEFLISIGTRKGKHTKLTPPKRRGWVTFTCPLCADPQSWKQTARCRTDGSLYQCFAASCPIRDTDPNNRGVGLARLQQLWEEL